MAASYRVRHQVVIVGSIDADERLVGFQRTEKTVSEVVRTDLTEAVGDTRSIVPSTVDEALGFGSISPAKVLYIESDQEVTIKLNGGSEVFKIKPTGGLKAKLLWDGEFTAISVSNAGSVAACVTYFIAG